MQQAYAGDEYVVKIRDREVRTALTHTSLSGSKIRKVALPKLRRPRRAAALAAAGKRSGQFPVHRRRVRVQARERRSDAHVRRRRRSVQDQHALQAAERRHAGQAAVDRVRLASRCTATIPRCGRTSTARSATAASSIATLDDMKVLYSGFDLTAPNTSVSMTINGPAPTILAMFMNTAIDQNLDKFKEENKRSPTDDEAAKIRAWVLENVRGTVQADILKEDQGQNTCIFSTEFSLKVMGDIQQYFVHNKREEFLLGQHQRLSHRRSGREPDQPARIHAVERLHVRRGVHGARHAHRRLCAEPELLLQQRHGPRVHGDGPRRAPHLGRGDARQVRRQRTITEAEVPLPDQRPLAARAGNPVQRHPHHAAGADRHLRQRQQPAHQRVRRSDHDADRRIACGAQSRSR